MAGLYDRLNGNDNIDVHYITAGLKGYGLGLATRTQVLNAINNAIETDLDAGQQADLTAIADVFDGKTANDKRDYVSAVEYAMTAGHVGALTDTQWRTALEI